MEIKDLKVGDTVLIKYQNGEYRSKKIVKATGDIRLYWQYTDKLEALEKGDVWVLDTPQGNEIFSQEDILLIHKILIIIGVSIVAIVAGNIIALW